MPAAMALTPEMSHLTGLPTASPQGSEQSCPALLSPKPQTVPSVISTSVCAPPQATAAQVYALSAGTRAVEVYGWALVPRPHWPMDWSPQV